MPLPPAPIDAFRKWTADRWASAQSTVIDALGDAGWHIGAEESINQLTQPLPEPEPFQAPPPVEAQAPPIPFPADQGQPYTPPPATPEIAPGPSLLGNIGQGFSDLGSRARGALQGTQEALAGINQAATSGLNTTSSNLAGGLQATAERTGTEDWASQALQQIDSISEPGLGSPETYANAADVVPLPPALEGIRPGLRGYTEQLGEAVQTLATDRPAVEAGARTVQRLTPAGLAGTLGEAVTGQTSPGELGAEAMQGLPALGAAAALVPMPGWQAGNVISQTAEEGALGVGLPAPIAGGIGLLADVATPDPGDVARVGRRAEALGDVAEAAPGLAARIGGVLGDLPYRFGEAARAEYGDALGIAGRGADDLAERQIADAITQLRQRGNVEAADDLASYAVGKGRTGLDYARATLPGYGVRDLLQRPAVDLTQGFTDAARVDWRRSQGAGQMVDQTGRVLGPDDVVELYHATDPDTAARMVEQGIRPGGKIARDPTIIQDEAVAQMLGKRVGDPLDYEPGRGLSQGFYVGANPEALSQYGDAVVGVRVRLGDLLAPAERSNLTAERALLLDDALVNRAIDPADVRLLTPGSGGPERAGIVSGLGRAAGPFMARAAETPAERAVDLGFGVAGGAAGAAGAPEDATWQERAGRAALGFAGGTLAGAHSRQLARVAGRALGPRAGVELAGDVARITPGEPFGANLADVTENVPPVPGTARGAMGKGPLERMPEPQVPAGAREITLTPDEETARLRLDKFPDWARDTIRHGAEEGGWFRGQRRGVLPESVQARMADDLERTTEQWIKDGRAGRTYNTEETRALANAIAGQAQRVNDLTSSVNAARVSGDVTDRMLAEWYTEGQKLQALTSLRSGNMAEWGRVGQALRAQAKAVDVSPGEAAQRLFAKVGDRDKALEALTTYQGLIEQGASPAALAGFWSRIERGAAGFGDWLSLVRYNSMLSGMPTMVVNAAGSAAELATKYPMDVASSLVRGRPGEIKAETQGALAGLRAAWEPMKQIIKHGLTDEAALAGGVPSGVAARTTNPAARGAATALEAPLRLQGATDEFFNRIAYGMSAGRRAAQRATEQGLSGQAWNEEVARLMNDLPPEMAARAKADADRITFRTDVDPQSVGGRIGRMRKSGGWVGEMVMPFFKTVYNITARGVERSPLGLAGTFVDASLKPFGKGAYAKSWSDPTLVKAGVTPVGERLANNVLGSAITLGFVNQALDGNLSGKGPDNPRDRDVLRAQGWAPYSIKLGDRWVSYSNWGPYAIPLALGAAVGEAKRYGVEGEPWSDTAGDALKQMGGLLADQPYLSGIGAIYRAVDDPERYGSQWLSQYLGSLIPYGSALSSVAAAGDEYEREAPQGGNVLETALGNVQARIPGMRERLPQRRDVFGTPIENTRQGLASQLPVRVAPEGADYTRDVRRYLGARDAAEDVRAAAAIRHVEDFINGRTIVRPTRAEQELYARFAGNENPVYEELTSRGRMLEQRAKIDAERQRLGAGSPAG